MLQLFYYRTKGLFYYSEMYLVTCFLLAPHWLEFYTLTLVYAKYSWCTTLFV